MATVSTRISTLTLVTIQVQLAPVVVNQLFLNYKIPAMPTRLVRMEAVPMSTLLVPPTLSVEPMDLPAAHFAKVMEFTKTTTPTPVTTQAPKVQPAVLQPRLSSKRPVLLDRRVRMEVVLM